MVVETSDFTEENVIPKEETLWLPDIASDQKVKVA